VTELEPGQAESWELAYRYDGAISVSDQSASHVSFDAVHRTCYTYCRTPGRLRRSGRIRQRAGEHCPHCYGPVTVRALEAWEVDPEPGRAERFAAWCGGWVTSFAAAVVSPFTRPDTADAQRAELIELAARGDHDRS